jgi:predicted nucleotidyltransferase
MKTLVELPVADGEKAAMEEAKRLLTEKFPVDRVILFGSKARGDDDEESDINLLVLTSNEIDRDGLVL